MTDRASTEEGLREARRKAQEAREDAEAYASPVHSTHDLADLIDALAGEVESLRRELYFTENNANRHAKDSFVLQKQNADLSRRLQEAQAENRKMREASRREGGEG
ncbi:MAG: hypothetical protein M3R38_01755 [Actinomycetota bacterium]|nr:hypothetical protein [Actinomycetota bacterium]